MSKVKSKYLNKLGVRIYTDDPIPYVKWKEIRYALKKHGLSLATFSKYFGSQTCSVKGMYYYDTEDVLARMIDGKLQGTQLFFD